MNFDINKTDQTKGFFLESEKSVLKFCANHPTCTKIFSPLLGFTLSLITLTHVVTFTLECALKAIVCFGTSLLCCQPNFRKGMIFTLKTLMLTVITPFFTIYSIYAFVRRTFALMCNPENYCKVRNQTIEQKLLKHQHALLK